MKKLSIGFNTKSTEKSERVQDIKHIAVVPRKSLADIYFSERNMTLSYYNDRFDLHKGDIVYVDGKLEGMQGIVVNVNYTFKIKLSSYKKVIAVADTNVKGTFNLAGSHIVTFEPNAIPYDKIITWFKAPDKEDEEYAQGSNNDAFPLDNLSKMKISPEIADRGINYYKDNRVLYISIDKTHGKAIVKGREIYEVEFDYIDGDIYNLVCSCFCSFNCKHEFAAMLQLRETLKIIDENYRDEYRDYFAAVCKSDFLKYTVGHKDCGTLVLK